MAYIPTIVEDRIASDAVTAAKIATDAVGSSEIATDAVTAAELAADSVGSSELQTDSVGTAELQADSVTSAKIAAGAVTTSKIAADAVTANELAADSVGASELADGAVDTNAIQNLAVTTGKIASDAVTSDKIAADAVTSTEIAAGAVGASEVADGSLTDAEFAAANIDGTTATPSLRTLGTGAQQALPGDATLDDLGAAAASLSLGGNTITNLGDGVNPTDAATVQQVTAAAAGYDPKEAVLYTTTGNIALTGTGTQANGTWPAALTAGDRILVKDQTDPIQNGIYEAAAGAWSRSADFDGTPAAEVSNGAYTLVGAADGSSLVGTGWAVSSPDPIVVDTDPIDWVQITSPGYVAGINDLSDVDTTGAVAGAMLALVGGTWTDSVNVLLTDSTKKIQFDAASNPNTQIYASGDDLFVQGTDNVEIVATQLRMFNNGRIDGAQIAPGYQSVSANFTPSPYANHTILANTSTGAVTITLPTANAVTGQTYRVKRRGANALTVVSQVGELIDGAASHSVGPDEAFDYVFTGSEWLIY